MCEHRSISFNGERAAHSARPYHRQLEFDTGNGDLGRRQLEPRILELDLGTLKIESGVCDLTFRKVFVGFK